MSVNPNIPVDDAQETPDVAAQEASFSRDAARIAVLIRSTIAHRLQQWGSRRRLGRMDRLSSRLLRSAKDLHSTKTVYVQRLEDPDLFRDEKVAAAERMVTTTDAPEEGPHTHSRYGELFISRLLLGLRMGLYPIMVVFDLVYLFGFFLNALEGPEGDYLKHLDDPKVWTAALAALLPTTIIAILCEWTGALLAPLMVSKSRPYARTHVPRVFPWMMLVGVLAMTVFLHTVASTRLETSSDKSSLPAVAFMTALPLLTLLMSLLAHLPRLVEAQRHHGHSRRVVKEHARHQRKTRAQERRFDAVDGKLQPDSARIQQTLDDVGQVADREALDALAKVQRPAPEWEQVRELATVPPLGRVAGDRAEWTGRPALLVAAASDYQHPRVRQILAVVARAHDVKAQADALDTDAALADLRLRAAAAIGVAAPQEKAVDVEEAGSSATVIPLRSTTDDEEN